MRWAVLGSRGMLGSELTSFLDGVGADVSGFHRGNLDFSSPGAISGALEGFDVVVNCVAYTQVDLAESEPQSATTANVEIPRRIVEAIGSKATRLIHISTDYVFSGDASAPYEVYSPKGPLGIYGRTKSEGEEVWLTGADNSQVIRTAWLYGANGVCFPKTVTKKLLSGEGLRVVQDQSGSPTWTWDLSGFIFEVAMAQIESRILHGVGGQATTWFGFANAIAASLDSLVPERIPESISTFQDLLTPVITESYPTPAKRPRSSILAQSSINGHRIMDWRSAWTIAAPVVLEELLGKNR